MLYHVGIHPPIATRRVCRRREDSGHNNYEYISTTATTDANTPQSQQQQQQQQQQQAAAAATATATAAPLPPPQPQQASRLHETLAPSPGFLNLPCKAGSSLLSRREKGKRPSEHLRWPLPSCAPGSSPLSVLRVPRCILESH